MDLHLHVAQHVGSIRHASGADTIRHENDVILFLCLEVESHHQRIHVNPIADNLGKQGLLVQHIGGETRFALVYSAPRMEGMCRRGGSRQKTRFRFTYPRITVTHTATDAQRSRMGNQFCCSWQFGRNGHQADLALRGLPEAFEQCNRGHFQQRVGMDSPLRMRKEWPFQMYPQRSSAMMADLRAPSNLDR